MTAALRLTALVVGPGDLVNSPRIIGLKRSLK